MRVRKSNTVRCMKLVILLVSNKKFCFFSVETSFSSKINTSKLSDKASNSNEFVNENALNSGGIWFGERKSHTYTELLLPFFVDMNIVGSVHQL